MEDYHWLFCHLCTLNATEIFRNSFIITSCNHTFCNSCFNAVLNADVFMCPFCKKISEFKKLDEATTSHWINVPNLIRTAASIYDFHIAKVELFNTLHNEMIADYIRIKKLIEHCENCKRKRNAKQENRDVIPTKESEPAQVMASGEQVHVPLPSAVKSSSCSSTEQISSNVRHFQPTTFTLNDRAPVYFGAMKSLPNVRFRSPSALAEDNYNNPSSVCESRTRLGVQSNLRSSFVSQQRQQSPSSHLNKVSSQRRVKFSLPSSSASLATSDQFPSAMANKSRSIIRFRQPPPILRCRFDRSDIRFGQTSGNGQSSSKDIRFRFPFK